MAFPDQENSTKLHEEISNKKEVYFKDKEISELRSKLERFKVAKEKEISCLKDKISEKETMEGWLTEQIKLKNEKLRQMHFENQELKDKLDSARPELNVTAKEDVSFKLKYLRPSIVRWCPSFSNARERSACWEKKKMISRGWKNSKERE